ncbi:helix-turn-helix transcriptional regulator [Mucilaginibacter sp. Bleaf8]|uniref:helix-turn-helix domain-containing protein n=1 Tax=Mucilaginibacter sp. Bleaf8 TaxID=2834430 RepID=UPI001BCEA16F|nr:helix-turn-helix transcriptional regulator [Mucilaginibacter sp. Bleaf8]MBS7565129.1 helix-turn-helix transcriptional regulator [Mucilaginibacter sp. Bleaf8]
MNFQIGQIIREKLEQKDITFRKFADHMGMSERNLQNFFKRKDISALQLQRASEYLKEDLTTYYKPKNLMSIAQDVNETLTDSKLIKVNIEIAGELEAMKNFHELLKEFKTSAKKLGFQLT